MFSSTLTVSYLGWSSACPLPRRKSNLKFGYQSLKGGPWVSNDFDESDDWSACTATLSLHFLPPLDKSKPNINCAARYWTCFLSTRRSPDKTILSRYFVPFFATDGGKFISIPWLSWRIFQYFKRYLIVICDVCRFLVITKIFITRKFWIFR